MLNQSGADFRKYMKYCRFCGKSIDDDSSFCTYCGKNQEERSDGKVFGSIGKAKTRFIEVISAFVQNASSKIKKTKVNSNSTVWKNVGKWTKRISISIIALILLGLLVLLGFWFYGFYVTSKWNKDDKRREAIALKDTSKAIKIASDLFKEYAIQSHRYDFDDSSCGFDHIEKGIAIIRKTAEKGDAKAQFLLGCIYAGARYDLKYFKWDNYETMMNTKIKLDRAAYWYYQASIQGLPSAMVNLANL